MLVSRQMDFIGLMDSDPQATVFLERSQKHDIHLEQLTTEHVGNHKDTFSVMCIQLPAASALVSLMEVSRPE